jgi:hypothetical protein
LGLDGTPRVAGHLRDRDVGLRSSGSSLEIEGLLYGDTHHGLEAVTNEALAVIPQTWERVDLQSGGVDGRGRHGGGTGPVQRSGQRRPGGHVALRSRLEAPRWKGALVEPFVDTLAEWSALGNAP